MLGGGAGGGGTLFYDERVRGRRLPLAVTAESRTPPCLLGTLVVRWGRTAVGFGGFLCRHGDPALRDPDLPRALWLR